MPQREVAALRECLDSNTAFPPDTSPHAMAGTLLAFLAALADPVVPPAFHPPAELEAGYLATWVARLLQQLPTVHHNVLVYVAAFMRELVAHRARNHEDPDLLGASVRHAGATCPSPRSPAPCSACCCAAALRAAARCRAAELFAPVLFRPSDGTTSAAAAASAADAPGAAPPEALLSSAQAVLAFLFTHS